MTQKLPKNPKKRTSRLRPRDNNLTRLVLFWAVPAETQLQFGQT